MEEREGISLNPVGALLRTLILFVWAPPSGLNHPPEAHRRIPSPWGLKFQQTNLVEMSTGIQFITMTFLQLFVYKEKRDKYHLEK